MLSYPKHHTMRVHTFLAVGMVPLTLAVLMPCATNGNQTPKPGTVNALLCMMTFIYIVTTVRNIK